jgi:hypothetical protein
MAVIFHAIGTYGDCSALQRGAAIGCFFGSVFFWRRANHRDHSAENCPVTDKVFILGRLAEFEFSGFNSMQHSIDLLRIFQIENGDVIAIFAERTLIGDAMVSLIAEKLSDYLRRSVVGYVV